MDRRGEVVALLLLVAFGSEAHAQFNSLESRNSSGTQQNGNASLSFLGASVSADGRYIAFTSYANNLVSNDNNGQSDIFLRDRVAGTTICCSHVGNATGNNYSQYATISGDGRYVVFESAASNLVAGDTNGFVDVFLYDAVTAVVTRIDVNGSGSVANFGGDSAAISGNGQFVAFRSYSTNLDSNDKNGTYDIYVRDLVAGTTTAASLDAAGTFGNGPSQQPSISDDGRFVAFESAAKNLGGTDTGAYEDVFLKDMQGGAMVRLSSKSGGAESNGDSIQARVCGDGSHVFFTTLATDLLATDANGILADVLVYDVASGVNSYVDLSSTGSQANRTCQHPAPSADGRYCAFASDSYNLDPLAPSGSIVQVFVRDLVQGRCSLESMSVAGAYADNWSSEPCLTSDGKLMVFASYAQNLDPTDVITGAIDVFFRDRGEVRFVEYGVGHAGKGGFVPHLWGKDGRETLGPFFLEMSDGLGGATGLLWIGTAPTDLFPVFGGHFYVDLGSPWVSLPIVLGGAAGVAGAGALEIAGTDLSAYDGTPFYLQLTLIDPGASKKISLSNGLEMHVGD